MENKIVCPLCQAQGWISRGEGLFVCPNCHGEGFVWSGLTPVAADAEAEQALGKQETPRR